MTLPRFFLDDQVLAEQTDEVFLLGLSDEDINHAKVLRMNRGEHIAVIDAAQDYFECEIESFDGQDMFVHIAMKDSGKKERVQVVLIQGIAKGEKMDTIIRQGTEIGVSEFIPLKSQRSVVKLDDAKAVKRRQRWQSIAKSAAMQSAQARIPEIRDFMDLEQVCDFLSEATVVVICWEEEKESQLGKRLHAALIAQSVDPEDALIAVIVGPEGGLDEAEVEALLGANGCTLCVSLGSSILRTETAGVLAPALVLYELGALA